MSEKEARCVGYDAAVETVRLMVLTARPIIGKATGADRSSTIKLLVDFATEFYYQRTSEKAQKKLRGAAGPGEAGWQVLLRKAGW